MLHFVQHDRQKYFYTSLEQISHKHIVMQMFIDILRNSVLITGLVVVMMMMIESLNIESKGMLFKGLRKTKVGQVAVAALLGSVPGCMGGFATVSLYTHRLFSFGALVAMMIASSGDEAFVMLAMIPDQALIIFTGLFVLAVIVGVAVDFIYDRRHARHCAKHEHEECGIEAGCDTGYAVHEGHEGADCHCHDEGRSFADAQDDRKDVQDDRMRHYGWKRIVMFVGLAVFIAALATGRLGHEHHHGDVSASLDMTAEHHDHGHIHAEGMAIIHEDGHIHDDGHIHEDWHVHDHEAGHGHLHEAGDVHLHDAEDEAGALHIDLLSEDWMNVLFAGLSVIVLFVLLFASDHFVEEHLWNHIVRKHLPVIFAWTFGVLLVLGIALQHFDITRWISDNTVLMILLATAIGIIPESGPHMIFVTLYAAGVVPMPVLLASCISQDGHASLPLIAESKKSFAYAKLINCVAALLVGYAAMLLL